MLGVMVFVYKNLVESFEILQIKLPKALRKQRSRNVSLMTDPRNKLSEARYEELNCVNMRIDALIASAVDAESIKLFGVVSLTKSNMVRLCGATLAVLASTVLRQIFNDVAP